MITEINNPKQYDAFINGLSSDPDFSDPHFAYDPDNLYLAAKEKDHHLYISEDNGHIDGIFVWLIIPEEKYVELIVGLSRSKEAWTAMIGHIEAANPGAQMDFVLNPGNTVLTEILKTRNAEFEKP